YSAGDAPQSVPTPSVRLETIGVERWHYDLWHSVIRAAVDGHPDQVDFPITVASTDLQRAVMAQPPQRY
ncbi:MAG TPA: hypothetical protein VGH32_12155, partial [Pirellulales bacterium]